MRQYAKECDFYQEIPSTDYVKHLGIHLDGRPTWKHHITSKIKIIKSRVRLTLLAYWT